MATRIPDLSGEELVLLEALLSGNDPVTPMGAFGRGGGMPRGRTLESIRQLINAGDEPLLFAQESPLRTGGVSDFEAALEEASEPARRRGFREGARRGLERGREKGIAAGERAGRTEGRRQMAKRLKAGGRLPKLGGTGIAGKLGIPKGIGGKLLWGGGVLGTAMLAFDILNMLRSSTTDTPTTRARDSYGQNVMADMRRMNTPTDRQQLRDSRLFRDLSQATANQRDSPVPMSPELRDLIRTDPNVLYKMRQQMNPSLREAYARAGLIQ
tara:strand:- start:52 stop:861 length:810 start_codon:yes stop_codon:yes gene_type:complete